MIYDLELGIKGYDLRLQLADYGFFEIWYKGTLGKLVNLT